MTLAASDIEELSRAIADRLYVQIAGWHLYLGDAGLAETLAIECAGRLGSAPGPAGAGRAAA